MQAHIQRWGNSLGLRIPMQVARQLNLHEGSPVAIEVEDGRIVIQPPKYSLEMMLEEITPENQHYQIFDGEQQGNEEW